MAVPRDVHFHANGLRFHALDWGRAGRPPLLMVHGAAQTAHSFDEVAPALSERHHVLSIDQRGHGDTAWAARYRREDFVADLGAVLDRRGWRHATLVAMSLGGLNAMAFAARHPGRVRALVVVDVVPSVSAEGVDAIGKQLALPAFPSFEAAVQMAQAFNPRRSVENIRERLAHSLRERSDGTWAYKFDPGIANGATELERLWHDVRRLRCPVLLVRGADSNILTHDNAERFVREAPRASSATVPDAGHSVMGDNPSGFLAAVTPFLARWAR